MEDIPEVKKTIAFIKKHLIKLQLKLEIQREATNKKIAFNIKHDSKSFYAYVRSKQKVQDMVGPLEGSDGNIITEGFLMAENLNEYFKGTQKGKVTCYARERVNKNKLF